MNRMGFWLAAILIFSTCGLYAQDVKNIQLKDEKISRAPKYYYVSAVRDDRGDTSDIGSVKTGLFGKNQRINLENGAKASIYRFIRQNAGQDTSANPIVLHISRLKVEESGRAGLASENELTIALAFYYNKDKLVEYTAGGTMKSTGDASKLVEELIRGNVDSILHQFDEWWFNNRAFYLGLHNKPTVKVEVTLYQPTDEPNIISYSPGRRLSLDDFQGKPDDLRNAAAVTYTLLLVTYNSMRTLSNEILLDVSVQANFLKSKSWFLQDHRNEETLQHEQGHFDILAIKACELVDTIGKFHFSPDNFSRELDKLQKEKQLELNQLQDLYDRETGRGAGPQQQTKWNQKIKESLQNASCFHS